MRTDERTREALLRTVDNSLPTALELYLDLHRHPELSGSERHTAARFARATADAGFTVTRRVGGHGVVAVLHGGTGPTIALRTELDALPVEERTGLPYASHAHATGPDGRRVPVMHACGHDLHTAAVTGTARVLAALLLLGEWRGTLVLVGQPAEETLSGARAMLADGLYERFPLPDAMLAQHVAPLPAGTVAHAAGGTVTAAGATLDVTVRGGGGHAAMPWLCADPLEAAAAALPRLRERMPEGVVLSVGTFHSGEQVNVVPERAELAISVRAFTTNALDAAAAAVHTVLREHCARRAGPGELEVTVTFRTPRAPCQVNDESLAAAVRQAHETVLGPGRVLSCPPSTAVEDFSWYGPEGTSLHAAPGVRTAYWMTGGVGKAQWKATPGATGAGKLAALPPNHSPRFAPDPVPSLRTGMIAMTAAALRCLRPDGGV
ncbi:amidohydrolase [Streptomyces sp. NPDC020379]|uniref:amidohydrolase n=1 Tax=Streptomyces sp. NPDC020379 TaxID=3365071 RepID=UPI0037A3B2D0